MLSLVCFALGGLLGWGTARGGDTVQRVWPVVLRVQILVTSATLSLVASWRLTSASELLGPLALAAGFWLLLGTTVVTRGRRSSGQSALEAWAVSPNSGFWVVPAATAFAGSTGTMIAVLANVITTAWGAVCVHLMRRDAPFRQRRATSWVDQSPVLASLIGLGLHLVGTAPSWTVDVLTLAGPLLAFSGAALFTGSVIHPHNLAVRHTEETLPSLESVDRRTGGLLPGGGASRARRVVDSHRDRGRPERSECAVLPTRPARRPLRVPFGDRRRRGPLGLAPRPCGPGWRRTPPLRDRGACSVSDPQPVCGPG